MNAVIPGARNDFLIRTKLNPPRLGGALIARPRLVEQLNRGLRRKLTLIAAPAGYGKTTLAVEWLLEQPHPAAWLSLDESDSDLTGFLHYFLAAIQTVFPGACANSQSMLEAPQSAPLDVFSALLINEIAELPGDVVLVLDDYHFIENAEVEILLAKLVEHLPPAMHLVILTRMEPRLPLPRLRVRRQLTEIRADDLRLTGDEVHAFLDRTVEIDIDQTTALILEERTEGWIAGLRLAALSLRGRSDLTSFVHSFKGTHRSVMDFLVSEVLDRQPEIIQRFLLQSSILDRFCADLCNAVIDLGEASSGSDQIIHRIERSQLFVVPLDDEGTWFRYHHLFQDLLRQQLRRRYRPEDHQALHRKASAWFEGQGFVEEALNHSLAAGDVLAAANIVEQSAHKLLNRDQGHMLAKWLDRLPEDIVERRPALLLARGWVYYWQTSYSGVVSTVPAARALLEEHKADDAVAQNDHARLWGELDAVHASKLYWQGDGQGCVDAAQRALACIPISHSFARGIAAQYLILGLQMTGQVTEAERFAQDALSLHPKRNQKFATLLRQSIAALYVIEGDLDRAGQNLLQTIKLAPRHQLKDSVATAHYMLGVVSYEQNKLALATQHFSVASELRYIANMRMVHSSLLGLALAYQARGMPGEANETVDRLLEFTLETRNPVLLTETYAVQAHIRLIQGDLESAVRWVQTVDLPVSRLPQIHLEFPQLTRARVLIARGNPRELTELVGQLDKLAQLAIEMHNTRYLIKISATQALAYGALERKDDALVALDRALVLSRPGGFVRTCLDLGAGMGGLLHAYAGKNRESEYTRQLLAAFAKTPMQQAARARTGNGPEDPFIEPLTDRELDVLALFSRRYTYKETAQELTISTNTVKKHAINIYLKLAVDGRREAVTRARALGLLPPD